MKEKLRREISYEDYQYLPIFHWSAILIFYFHVYQAGLAPPSTMLFSNSAQLPWCSCQLVRWILWNGAKPETVLIWQDESKVHLSEIFAMVSYSSSLMAISHNLQPPKSYILMAIDLKIWSYTVKLRNRKANCRSYKVRPCDFRAILELGFRHGNQEP